MPLDTSSGVMSNEHIPKKSEIEINENVCIHYNLFDHENSYLEFK